MEKHYYKVDVSGRFGYSFMVVSKDELTEYEVIEASLKHNLFNDEEDADYATVDDLVTDYDIVAFKNVTHKI